MSTTPPEPPPTRPASTVIVARAASVAAGADASARPEILLLRRHGSQGFMANLWVFPGGRVDEADQAAADPWRSAAVRECAEEAGVTLAGELFACAHWVTPTTERKRFDTRFYLTTVPAGTEAVADATEVTEARWISAADALARHAAVDLPLAPPTWMILRALAPIEDVAGLEAWARAQRPEPIMPVLELTGGKLFVRMPGASLTLVEGRWELADGV